jgi:hypothetical protein
MPNAESIFDRIREPERINCVLISVFGKSYGFKEGFFS